jgi:DNA-binding beta-propeller fold protein YncE
MRSVCVVLALGACTASREEVQPPADELFFPTGAAIAPDESVLFVSNANSELRYDSGTVGVVDLDVVDAVATDWVMNQTAPGGCEPDPVHRETLTCCLGDQCRERGLVGPALMRGAAATRIGNFATDIAVQDFGGGAARLIVPTRGDPSIAFVEWDGNGLTCNTGAQGFALCDESHRLSYVHDDPDLALLPDEPFDAFADSAGGYAVVTHLTTGAVTLIDSPAGSLASIADVVPGLFAADPASGIRGATGVAGRTPGGMIYVASRSEDRVQMVTVGRPVNNQPPYLIPGNYFFLDLVGNYAGGSSDARSISFSPAGDRMYLLNRRPPSLQIYDTSLSETGFPKNDGIGATDICRAASTLTVLDAGDGDRAYITCFQDGQVYIVDPRGLGSVEDIVLVGRGPYSIVGSKVRKKVYVTNFLEDTIAVIDVSPTSPRHNRVVLRIGQVRPL